MGITKTFCADSSGHEHNPCYEVPASDSNDQARVTRSMITANQRSLPEKCIGINTSEPMVRANHPSSPRIGKAFPLVVVGSISVMFQRLFDV